MPKIEIATVKPAYFYSSKDRRVNAHGGKGSQRASLDLSGVTGKKNKGASGGGEDSAGPASHDSGKMVDSGAAANAEGDPLMVPEKETQAPIMATGRKPAFSIGNSANGNIDLGSLLSERTNAAFDATKPVGGDNVPFQPTTGLGGWFRRAFGDQSNEKNLQAQGQQGARWEAEKALKDQQAREDARDMNKFNQQLAIQTNADEERKAERAAAQKMHEEDRDAAQRRWASTETANIYDREQADIDRNLNRTATTNHQRAMEDLAKQELEIKKKLAEAKGDPTPHVTALQDGSIVIAGPNGVNMFDKGTQDVGNIKGRPAYFGPVNMYGQKPPLPKGPPATGAPAAAMPQEQAPAVMPIPGGVMPPNQRIPVVDPAEESMDPYELQAKLPQTGTMVDYSGNTRRAPKFLAPTFQGWRIGQ